MHDVRNRRWQKREASRRSAHFVAFAGTCRFDSTCSGYSNPSEAGETGHLESEGWPALRDSTDPIVAAARPKSKVAAAATIFKYVGESRYEEEAKKALGN